jgi:hypothetical protein
MAENREVDCEAVKVLLDVNQPILLQDPHIRNLNLGIYDRLLASEAVSL